MTVYVVQQQMRWDAEKGELVPKFPKVNLASEHGELKFLLSPTAAPFRPGHIAEELCKKLDDFNDDDYLLLIGNPVLIGMAVTYAADSNEGRVKVLQWHGRNQGYIPIQLDLFPADSEDEDQPGLWDGEEI